MFCISLVAQRHECFVKVCSSQTRMLYIYISEFAIVQETKKKLFCNAALHCA